MTSKSSNPLKSLDLRHVRHVIQLSPYARENTGIPALGAHMEHMSHLSHGSLLGVARRGGRGAPAFHALQNFWNRESNSRVPAHSGISRNPRERGRA
ncbi:hypothetical protein EV663_109107 [Rhodovulum bhavnagarense]|uniref:Uncharacterized protein n=1 Tax=Rhodovulum bhavnagarense TaxID=992286 RepID=A0A4R2REC9_9RHOB|nr:hypothetical protein EV663_109107 [Rhodovulum bhavnagarense]